MRLVFFPFETVKNRGRERRRSEKKRGKTFRCSSENTATEPLSHLVVPRRVRRQRPQGGAPVQKRDRSSAKASRSREKRRSDIRDAAAAAACQSRTLSSASEPRGQVLQHPAAGLLLLLLSRQRRPARSSRDHLRASKFVHSLSLSERERGTEREKERERERERDREGSSQAKERVSKMV